MHGISLSPYLIIILLMNKAVLISSRKRRRSCEEKKTHRKMLQFFLALFNFRFLGEESSISAALGSTETDRNAAAAEAGQLVDQEQEGEEGRTSWLETDIDTSRTRDRADDTVSRENNKVVYYNFLAGKLF